MLRLPLHRRFLWWYSGRVIIRLKSGTAVTPGSDRVTVTHFCRDGLPRIVPLRRVPSLDGPVIDLRAAGADLPFPDGPACLLVHEEYRRSADLRQLRLSGDIRNSQLVVSRRTGSLSPAPAGLRRRIAELREMAKMAEANRPLLAGWRNNPTEGSGPPSPLG